MSYNVSQLYKPWLWWDWNVVGCHGCRQAEESEATLGVMLSAISQDQEGSFT